MFLCDGFYRNCKNQDAPISSDSLPTKINPVVLSCFRVTLANPDGLAREELLAHR